MTTPISPSSPPLQTRRNEGRASEEAAPTEGQPAGTAPTVARDAASTTARPAGDPVSRLKAPGDGSPVTASALGSALGKKVEQHHQHAHHKDGVDRQSNYGVKLEHGEQKYAKGLKQFEADTRKKVDEFAKRLKADPEYQKASKPENWTKMTTDEKKAFADHVAKIQGDVFGFTPAPTELKRTEPDKNGDIEYGSYEDDTNKLVINSHPKAMGNFKEFMDTVAHEQFHAYQHQLTQGTYPPDSPLHAASEVYKINDKHYHEADKNYTAYRRQPAEAHAFMVGERLRAQLFGRGQ